MSERVSINPDLVKDFVIALRGRRVIDVSSLRRRDDRLAAIQTCLKLGFEPEIVEPSHSSRWEHLREVLHQIG